MRFFKYITCIFLKQRARHFATILVMCTWMNANAQQEWSYTQYLFNLYDINSAYAGNHGSASFALRHRSQWMGMEGAPITQQFSFHTPVKEEKIGVGFKVMNESIGARKQQFVSVSGAYKLRLGSGILSMGLAAGIIRQAIDRPKISAADQQDVNLVNLAEPLIIPNLDASLFYNTKEFYVGLQSCRINRSMYTRKNGTLARLYYNLNMTAGVMKKVGSDNMLQLSTLVKYSEGKLWQAEWNLLYLIKNKFWLGGGYRLNSGCSVLGSINFSTQFRIGFSYDFPLTALRHSNDGSAEVFLGYNLKSRSGKSIRYF
jgi:type IX secretion system PorP/SprF family membrane protein